MNKTKIAVDVFNKFANEYQAKFMDFDLYNDTFDLLCNSIEKSNSKILDVACGPGNISRYLLQKRPDFVLTGIDLAPKMLELAKTNNPSAQFQLMDGRNILKINQKFDAIVCGFLFPYLSKDEAIKFIMDAEKMLNPDGILYISTMEEDANHQSGIKKSSAGNEMYVYYHKADYLIKAIEENNFSLFDLQRKEFPEENGTVTDLILICKKIDLS